jgi:hypothetical protein
VDVVSDVPADSTVTSGGLASDKCWASNNAAEGERQRFPVQTKSTVVMLPTFAQYRWWARKLVGPR